MILFVDLVSLDNLLATELSLKFQEKIIFAHNFKNVNIVGDTPIEYVNITKFFEMNYAPDIIIINRNNIHQYINGHNIIKFLCTCFSTSKVVAIVSDNDTIPADLPSDVSYKIVTNSTVDISMLLYEKLKIKVDVERFAFSVENFVTFINKLKPTKTDKKKVLCIKRTNLAYAPDELVKAINKYSQKYQAELSLSVKDGFDILHYNNIYIPTDSKARKIIQYHSEPIRVTLPSRSLNALPNPKGYPFPSTQLVLAQYHATLPEYKDMQHVRNIINFDDALYTVQFTHPNRPLRVAYSPSVTTRINEYYDKGYEKTKKILESIKDIEYDIITGVSLQECIQRKANSDIIIDECVTGSYHRSGLEGLALGKMTICYLNSSTEKVLSDVIKKCITNQGGSTKDEITDKFEDIRLIPFENVKIDDLEIFLKKCVDMSKYEIQKIGIMNRKWMEKYWHPKIIVNEFEKIYNELK